jgi:hypothetical protein
MVTEDEARGPPVAAVSLTRIAQTIAIQKEKAGPDELSTNRLRPHVSDWRADNDRPDPLDARYP